MDGMHSPNESTAEERRAARRLAAERDAEILRAYARPDDLDELVAWTPSNLPPID